MLIVKQYIKKNHMYIYTYDSSKMDITPIIHPITTVTQNTPLTMNVTQNSSLTMNVTQNTPLTMNVIQNTSLTMNGAQNTPLTMSTTDTTPLTMNVKQTIPLSLNVKQTIPLSLNVKQTIPLSLNVIDVNRRDNKEVGSVTVMKDIGIPSDHLCYILKSSVSERTYIGYTINFPRRIRQHNGEISGGAKKTRNWRPWYPICLIRGFYEASSALRFEYRLQHAKKRKGKTNAVTFVLETLVDLINSGEPCGNNISWPLLNIKWYNPIYSIQHPKVINEYAI